MTHKVALQMHKNKGNHSQELCRPKRTTAKQSISPLDTKTLLMEFSSLHVLGAKSPYTYTSLIVYNIYIHLYCNHSLVRLSSMMTSFI